MKALDLVTSFGPTPLDELTARVTSNASQVATEINELSKEDLLQVTDGEGNAVHNLTERQAESEPFLVALTNKGLKRKIASY